MRVLPRDLDLTVRRASTWGSVQVTDAMVSGAISREYGLACHGVDFWRTLQLSCRDDQKLGPIADIEPALAST